ncbi:MAG TPA: serine hydrolase [Gemmatimonadaceae bacterium]|jgi:CubicO group peptidase (beta-lactamase class C family)|nr:serine hydrolase [Gemmatimonadaceae bacterium]
MRNRILVLTALGAAVPCAAQRPTPRTAPPDWTAFDRYVAQAARDWRIPALAIAIVKDDSVVFAKGYGVLQTGTTQRADEHTRFAIGSTTKAMTSASLAMLVDEGKLHWDDHVTQYIPELQLYDPYATHELTIRDLLTHRTGLPGTDMFWARWEYPRSEIIRRLRYIPPETSFRSTWEYQNVMYSLAGTIIERVSGMPWETFVRQRIFAPLDMNETEPLVATIRGKPNVAVPHVLAGDSVRVVPMRSTDPVASAGSVWSSVSDMSKWMRFVLDSGRVGSKRLIAQSTFRELITPQIRAPMAEYPALQLSHPDFFSYGFGWFIQDYAGQQVWMHTGSIDGMCAIIGLMPNEHLGVYVLENLDHAELRHGLMYSAFDLFNGGPSRDWSAELRALFSRARAQSAVATAAARTERPMSVPIDRYVGTYVDSAYGSVTITLAGSSLRARVVSEPEEELEHADVDVFRTRPADAGNVTQLVFTPNGTGGISDVRVYGIPFRRVPSPAR